MYVSVRTNDISFMFFTPSYVYFYRVISPLASVLFLACIYTLPESLHSFPSSWHFMYILRFIQVHSGFYSHFGGSFG